MNDMVDGMIASFAPKIRAAITRQVEAAAAAVRSGGNVIDAIEGVSIKDAYGEAWKDGALSAAGAVYNAIDGARKDFSEEQYQAWERAVAEHIALEGGGQITLIDNYTKEWVRATVQAITAEAIEEGLGTDEIAGRLVGRWQELSDARALRIAQTEMNAAANWGSLEAGRAAGMTHKEWITAGDRRVRDGSAPGEANHVRLNGEVVPIDQPFSNGLMWPSQPGGPASQTINCRCTVGFSIR